MRGKRKWRRVQLQDRLQVVEMAKFCGVTRSTIYAWIRSGRIKSLVIGDLLRPLRKGYRKQARN
jgi:excisionase family DNA binding protein